MKLLKTLAGLVPLVTGFLILAFLASCDLGTPPSTGGGGTEVEGIIVDQHGNPAAGIWVRVYPDSSMALGKKSESSESFVAIRDSARTNAYGAFVLPNLPSGTYNLVATVKRNDTTLALFRRSIVVNGNANLGTDTLRIAGGLSLQVVLDATNIGGALCYIPGSPYIAVTASSGICTLIALPPGIYNVSVASPGLATGQTGNIAVISFQVTTAGTLNLLQFIVNPLPSQDSVWNVTLDSIPTLIIGDAPPAFRDSVPFTRLAQVSFMAYWGDGNGRGRNFYPGDPELNPKAFTSQVLSTLLYGSNPGHEPWTGASVRATDARGTVTHFDTAMDWRTIHRSASKFRRAAFALSFPDSTHTVTGPARTALKITRVVVRKNGSIVLDSTRTAGFTGLKYHAFVVGYLNRVGTDSLEISALGNWAEYSGLLFKGSVVLTPATVSGPLLNMAWMGPTSVITVPGAPILNAPANGASILDLGVLNWRTVSGAASYQAQISTDSGFAASSSLKLNDSGFADTTRAFSVPATAQYFWRVRASNIVGVGAWSMVRNYSGVKSVVNCVLALNQTPVLVSPANGAVNVATPAALTWDSTCNALGYRLQVATDSNFTNPLVSNDSLTSISTNVLLSSNTLYYWRVGVKYTAGWSSWSIVRKFTVGTAPGTLTAPTLVSPAQFATGVSRLPTLTWTAVSGATMYQFQVSASAAFTSIAYSDSVTGTSHTKTSAALSANTDYYWRVKAISGSGSSAYSNISRFTTGTGGVDTTTAPGLPSPTLLTPTVFATNVTQNPALTWTAVNGATAYGVQVSTTVNFSNLLVNDSSVTGTSRTVALALNTTYYWRVRAKSSTKVSPYSEVWTFTTGTTIDTSGTQAPAVPVLTAPVNFATNVSRTPNLTWIAASGATSYGVQVSTSATFSSFLTDTSASMTSKQLSGLPGNATYYWRVRAKNPSGNSAYSEIRVFTTEPVAAPDTTPLAAPVLTAPSQFSTGVSTSPTLTWSAVSGASSYALQVSLTASFSSTVLSKDSINLTSWVVSGLAGNTEYYWRVRARTSSKVSAYSAAFRFTTGAAPITGVWTSRTSGTVSTLYSVVALDSLHYTTGSDSLLMTVGAAGTLLTSTTGQNWATQTSGTTNALYTGNGSGALRISVGANGTVLSTPPYMSPWTQRTSGTTNTLYGATWDGSKYLVVGANGAVLTSTNGDTWTLQASGTTRTLNSVEWNGAVYAAVGANGVILTSVNGTAWTTRDSTSTGSLYSVTWTGSQFIAVGTGGIVRRSVNGTTWTTGTAGTANDLYAVDYGAGVLRAVGATGTVVKSSDGITWTTETSSTTQNLYGVSKFKSGWVAVGAGGTIMTLQ